MTNLFTAKPFISHDGPDEKKVRAEVEVFTGFSTISEIKDSKNGNSKHVSFVNPKSEHDVKGWAWVNDEGIISRVEKAFESGEPLHFRIEKRRKPHIDRSLPMSKVSPPGDMAAARDNVIRSLVAVRFDDEKDWAVGRSILTRFDEDPKFNSGFNSANDYSLEELNALAGKGSSNDNQQGSGYSSGYSRSSSIESAPFKTLNPDGTVNPGGPAVSVRLNFMNFIYEWLRDHDDVKRLNKRQVMLLADKMTEIANMLQVAVYEGDLEKPDYELGSHTRARSVVYDTIRNFYPITNEALSSRESVNEWAKNVTKEALENWHWALSQAEDMVIGDKDGEDTED